ncbi:hypothetical protein AZG88_00280 [Rhodococcus sp. LB1]|nr:hypothetical protein AZG88_00280 [Rhodococcus sp. LB1]
MSTSSLASHADLAAVISLWKAHGINADATRYSLDDVNQALQDLAEHKIAERGVPWSCKPPDGGFRPSSSAALVRSRAETDRGRCDFNARCLPTESFGSRTQPVIRRQHETTRAGVHRPGSRVI